MPTYTQPTPPGFLPAPTMPMFSNLPDAAQVAAVVGEDLAAPLTAVEATRTSAEQALAELEASRPGTRGTTWRDAEQADREAVATGNTPSALAHLLAGEHQRWGNAAAHAANYALALQTVGSRLDRPGIIKAASKAETIATKEWTTAARTGWDTRHDPATAWAHRRTGEDALTRWRTAAGIRLWASGNINPSTPGRALDYRLEDAMPTPDGPATTTEASLTGGTVNPADEHLAVTRGMWLGLLLTIGPPQRWHRLPDRVIWPDGAWELVEKTVDPRVHEILLTGFREIEDTTHKPARKTRPLDLFGIH